MQNALLLIAHGSRRTQSNDEIRALARQIGARAGSAFDRVDCAFLELAEPSIGDGIARLVEAGARHVLALPYFLSDGRHVHEDIPAQVNAARRAHPHVAIGIAPYVGTAPTMPDLLLSMADHAREATAQ